jgi:hypothetical protein
VSGGILKFARGQLQNGDREIVIVGTAKPARSAAMREYVFAPCPPHD